MRCPKCGFISFDHLDTCLKCNKSIKATSDILRGGVYNVAAPSFLKFSTEPENVEEMADPFIDDSDIFADEEIRDPDLDILLDEEVEEESGTLRLSSEEEPEEENIQLSLEDEEDGEIAFSLEGFEDEAELSELEERGGPAVKPLSVPDELSDISDLEQPALREVIGMEEATETKEEDFDLDIDFDLSLEDEESGDAPEEIKGGDLGSLSLKDLDLEGEELDEPVAARKPAVRKSALDEDFNFELDLGDLKLDDKE